MASHPRVKPAVNQIELHPFNTHTDIRAACAKHGIILEAYSPLAQAQRMKHPDIVVTAKKYKCTPAQLMVRSVKLSVGREVRSLDTNDGIDGRYNTGSFRCLRARSANAFSKMQT